jgi:hypothetical protein
VRVLRGADREIPADVPPGEVVAELDDGARQTYYSFARRDGRLLLRFHGAAEIDCDDALHAGTMHVHPGFDPGVLGVLLPGTVMAARLLLDGRLVLHASAVAIGETALAFVGSPGMGKSTLAGLAVAAGLPLLTDDVLRTDLVDDGARVWSGAGEVRLRAAAASVVELAGGRGRHTADGRLALGARAVSPLSALPLTGCVVPFPRRDVDRVSVRRLAPFAAFRQLTGFPRITGWCEPVTLARQFDHLGSLCERVPVFEADIPWGPPFDPAVIGELLDRLASAASVPA